MRIAQQVTIASPESTWRPSRPVLQAVAPECSSRPLRERWQHRPQRSPPQPQQCHRSASERARAASPPAVGAGEPEPAEQGIPARASDSPPGVVVGSRAAARRSPGNPVEGLGSRRVSLDSPPEVVADIQAEVLGSRPEKAAGIREQVWLGNQLEAAARDSPPETGLAIQGAALGIQPEAA